MQNEQPEFWETAFNEKQEMWGFEPANSAVLTSEFFSAQSIKTVLIPGIGYGRNAQIFLGKGMMVTGIEISPTAIEMANKHFGPVMEIHHGSVTDMPFDNSLYDGIFSHAVIHLLDRIDRMKLIADCYRQLIDGGFMVFSMISKKASTYGQGTAYETDQFEMYGGVRLFFYDRISVEEEFSSYGLVRIQEVTENFPFYLVTCKKA